MTQSPTFDYAGRVRRLQETMMDRGIDAVLLSVGSDLPYFSGYTAMASERLTVMVVPKASIPILVIPKLEAPRVGAGEFSIVAWGETDDPVALATAAVGKPNSVMVGDQMWSAFLVSFLREWPHATWSRASDLTKELRMRKEPEEIEALRRAAHGVDRVMARMPVEVSFGGRTEKVVSQHISEMVIGEGHDRAGLAIVGSGPNGASPHHEPSNRTMQEGDLVVCDFGGSWDGYQSDSTRTFVIGDPSTEQSEMHALVRAANEAGRSAVASGVQCQEVDRAARRVIEEAGYGEHFIHRTGHGIGLDVHEHPYMVEGNGQELEVGMTFSVEPGVYLQGRFGVRIEDIVACGLGGPDTLNEHTRELVVVA